ncbi:hypothetical protein KP509_24G053500 [Ceratopteris richardii]|nr:hypothetical protein KP509_24G053500 [Ceratopteris richardii]
MENRIKASNLIGKIEADMKGPRKRGFRDDADAGRIDAGVCGNKREIGNPHQAMAQSDAVEHETKIVRTRPPLGGIKQRMSVVLRTAFQSKCRAPYLLCRTGIRSKCRALNSLRKAGARKEVVLLVCLSGLAMATCLLTSLSSSSSSRTKSSPYSFHNLYPMPLAPVRYFI